MNPPYKGNLHLSILQKTLNHYKDDIINLSPCEWVLDGYAKYKKDSDYNKYNSLLNFVSDFTMVGMGSKYFDLTYDINLSIYKISNDSAYDFIEIVEDSVIDKVVSYAKKGNSIEDHMGKEIDGNVVYVNRIYGGSFKNGGIIKPFGFNYDTDEKIKKFITGNNGTIKFNSSLEAENFSMSAKTLFYTYLMYKHKSSIRWNLKYLPFMNDYTHKWTSEDFYEFFNISDEESRKIELALRDVLSEDFDKYF